MLNNKLSHSTPIFIIAGEVSGDIFAAELMTQIKDQIHCQFVGCGGIHMQKQGLINVSTDNSLLSAIGLVEAIRFLFKHSRILNSIVPNIKKNNCKHVILVDHEVFSILAAKKIRRAFGNSIKIYFFIPPRVSMWGAKNASMIAKLCDALFCYMQPDLPIYKKYNKNSFFFGNPLSKKLKTFISHPDFFIKNNLNPNKQYIALMPGSRNQEIKQLLPIFLKTALRLNVERNVDFLITLAHKDLAKKINQEIEKSGISYCVHLVDDSSLQIMSHCALGFVSAGTITLEAVMMGMYPIITYKVSDFTFKTIKKTENLNDETLVGLPNVFLNARVFPEILQFEVTSDRLYHEAIFYLDMAPEMKNYLMSDAKEKLNETLGSIDSIKNVANYIVNDIQDSYE
ncbi:MAG: hypothetical protein KFW21_04930 [Spirochaetota bacterium]|nr:hypothetical protein [Spirochaetota bacterium]